MTRQLSDLTVLVTGGSRGIGRALCLELAEAGACVYTCARSHEGLEVTAAKAHKAPGEVHTDTADITDPAEFVEVFERIDDEREERGLDVLVNNAGLLGVKSTIENYPVEEWRRTMAVNVNGSFLAAKLATPLLRRGNAGLILNMSSSVGRKGRAEWGAYSASKFAVEGLNEILADELEADGIASVSVNPGGTATDMRADAYPEEDPETIPTARQVARTLTLLVESVGIGQTGRRYNSRDLFDWVDRERPADADALPHVQ